jgi:hypothetical protein
MNEMYGNEAGYVYNGQNSVLWNNVRDCFPEKIRDMYKTLRDKENRLLSFEDVTSRFTNHQKVWGEAIFNEDMYLKHLVPLLEDKDATYLKMALGDKALQRIHWLYNRFRFFDSKHIAGDTLTDNIFFRAWGDPNSVISLTPYADIYTCVEWASQSETKEESLHRTKRGETKKHPCPLDFLNETEINIFSASQLNDIGDLSSLKVGGINSFKGASRIKRLKLGDGSPKYTNSNLSYLSLGNNTLLQELDVRNCVSLKESIDLTESPNIERVYCEGTIIPSVSLPKGGILKELCLPTTVNNLTIIGHPSLTKLTMTRINEGGEVETSYSSLSTLHLEGVNFEKKDENGNPVIDFDSMIAQAQKGCRLRIRGLKKTFKNATEIEAFYRRLDDFAGLDNQGINTPKAQFEECEIYCKEISIYDYNRLTAWYDIDIKYDTLTAVVKFYLDEESKNSGDYLTKRTVVVGTNSVHSGGRCDNPINDGTDEAIETPTKENSEFSKSEFNQWNTDLESIKGDTDVIAVFNEYMMHKVTFVNDKGDVLSENTYYLKDGENVIVAPKMDRFYDDVANSQRMYFQYWENCANKEKTDFPLVVTQNVYEELTFKAVYDTKVLYIVKFINPYDKRFANTNYEVAVRMLEAGGAIELPEEANILQEWYCEDGVMGASCEAGKHQHNFIGWSETEGGNLDGLDTKRPEATVGTSNLNYYAVYDSAVMSYDIKFYNFDDDGNKVLHTLQTLPYGSTITPPTVSRAGHTFNGWISSIDNDDRVVRRSVDYTADYSINYYSVTFKYLNAEGVQVTDTSHPDVPYKGKPTAPNVPNNPQTKTTNYSYKGWDISPNDPITGNTVYTAQYGSLDREYTVTWVINNKVVTTTTETYNPEVRPTTPSGIFYADYWVDGKVFLGWSNRGYCDDSLLTGKVVYGISKGTKTVNVNWSTTGISSDTYHDISKAEYNSFTAKTDDTVFALRKLIIDTANVPDIGFATTIQSITAKFTANYTKEYSWAGGIASVCGALADVSSALGGYDEDTVEIVNNEPQTVTRKLGENIKSQFANSDGKQYTWFGLYERITGDVTANFWDVSFDIEYHTND